jgi:hypothetical protein
MNVIGKPRSSILGNKAEQIELTQPLANQVYIQAQEGDISYRLDGSMDTIDGFILPQNATLTLFLAGKVITVWSTKRGVRTRLIIQEMRV